MDTEEQRILNVNVGVLGHVDCGKTSLVAALSTTLSTAALDKHPQSKERGITLDLGFSCFTVPIPLELKASDYTHLQFTLVDCPGHASLIRTIIGGAQIIDLMMLVVDVTKGLQAQTAECLVVGEITAPQLLLVLNKVDLLPQEQRDKAVRKAHKRLREALAGTKFARAPMVTVSARPGGEGKSSAPEGVQELQAALLKMAPQVARPATGSFLFAVDHCFAIKGQGTVLTGTCLQGKCCVGDTVELPALKLTRQVKSMQMFKRPVQEVQAGGRAGLCITKLDPSLLERGLAAAPGTVPTFSAAIARVEKIRFYPSRLPSKSRMHVILGHSTVMAELTFFGTPPGAGWAPEEALQEMINSLSQLATSDAVPGFNWEGQYLYQGELYGLEGRPPGGSSRTERLQQTEEAPEALHFGPQWALVQFEGPVTCPADGLVIGAKLDADVHGEACRLAFYGRMLGQLDAADPKQLQRLRVYKEKQREGSLSRIAPDRQSAVCSNMFKKETDISAFVGLIVVTGRGEEGRISGRFGASGRFTVDFPQGLTPQAQRKPGDNVLLLKYKRYVFDTDRRKVVQQ